MSKDKKILSMRDIGQLVALTVVIFLLLKVFFVLAFVPTGSMEPTIKEKSAAIGWRLSYLLSDPLPDHGEIIIFDHEEFNEHLVKRVIGLPDYMNFGCHFFLAYTLADSGLFYIVTQHFCHHLSTS